MHSPAAQRLSPAGDGFNIADMDPGGPKSAIAPWLFDQPQWWMGLLRRFWPVARLPGGWVMVTRFDDVREVLANERVFNVPFGERMMEMDRFNALIEFILAWSAREGLTVEHFDEVAV